MAEARQRGARPRDRADVAHHIAGLRIQGHLEQFLAGLGVVRQRPVRDAEPRIGLRAHSVDHAASADRARSKSSRPRPIAAIASPILDLILDPILDPILDLILDLILEPSGAGGAAAVRAWERAFDEARTDGTRKDALRSAMTLSPDRGGVFDTLVGLVRRGLGGGAGSGRQVMSWIHYEDFVAAVRWLIDRDDVDGVVNAASPNPVPNAAVMRILREAFGVAVGLPAAE